MENKNNLPVPKEQPPLAVEIPEERPTKKLSGIHEQRFIVDGTRMAVYGENDIHVFTMDEATQKIMDVRRTGKNPRDRKVAIAQGAGHTLMVGQYSWMWLGEMPEAAYGASSVAVVGLLGYALTKRFSQPIKELRHVNRTVREAAHKEDALTIADREVSFALPKTFLDKTVSFNSELGISEALVGDLLPKVTTFPGFSIRQKRNTVSGKVQPWDMYRSSLNLFSEQAQRDQAAEATWTAFRGIQEAVGKLPDRGLDNQSPESIREVHAIDMEQLAIGALTAFAAVRSEYSPLVSKRVRDFYYAKQEEERPNILKDAQTLNDPTTHNLSWAHIESFSKVFAK